MQAEIGFYTLFLFCSARRKNNSAKGIGCMYGYEIVITLLSREIQMPFIRFRLLIPNFSEVVLTTSHEPIT